MDLAGECPGLAGPAAKAFEPASSLSYGEQRRLEIARALALSPRLLLLDEPAAGMNPQEKQALAETVREIRGRGVTVLLVEHDMRLVMNVSDRIHVLANGRTLAEGTAAEVRVDPAVIQAYLGAQEVGRAVG